MNAFTANPDTPKQEASFSRWLLAFFAPTYVYLVLMLVPANIRETPVPGGTLVVLLGVVSAAGLWFCLREVVRVQRPVWQRGLLALATTFGLAVQVVIDIVFFGLLSMALWGFSGPS
jgi:hypothetical protein